MPALLIIIVVSTTLITIDIGCYLWLRANHARRNQLCRCFAGHINF